MPAEHFGHRNDSRHKSARKRFLLTPFLSTLPPSQKMEIANCLIHQQLAICVVALEGFEPTQAEPASDVLPLHNKAKCCRFVLTIAKLRSFLNSAKFFYRFLRKKCSQTQRAAQQAQQDRSNGNRFASKTNIWHHKSAKFTYLLQTEKRQETL